ncbi:MAG: PaaI family thioesterase [Pseudomonadota bacterium]
MITTIDAQAFLEANFATWVLDLRPRVVRCDADGLDLNIPVTDAIARVGGIVSGQALAALADTAMVLAAGAHQGRMLPVATVTLDTQFLRPGRGEVVRASAHVLRAGRSMIFARCTLSTRPSDKAIAHATATCAVPPG